LDKLVLVAKTLRVTQWVKNIIVFAPIVFSGFLLVPGMLPKVFLSFILFCILSSAIYVFNDLVDIKADRQHPFKKNRPIASGKLPIMVAWMIFAFLASLSMFLGYVISDYLLIAMLMYFGLNVSYSLLLKHIPIVDVFSIATGFVIRVYAGAFVINVHMDVWFLLTVVSASLFLAVGKRRSEMTLMAGVGGESLKSRATLMHYKPDLLDAYTSMFANTTWLTYALFSFLHPPFIAEGRVLKIFSLLPRTLIAEKWLMATVPLVIYGVMRYMQLIYEKNKGESPHKVLMTDWPLITVVIVWGVLVLSILYLI
jgi:decaprenyl-phosphate phosphoribosyltransferase